MSGKRYVASYDGRQTGKFTVFDTLTREPAVGPGGRAMTGLSHSTADEMAEKLNRLPQSDWIIGVSAAPPERGGSTS